MPRTALFASLLLLTACADRGVPEEAGFDAFEASLERESFEGGVWLFDGDLPVDSEKRLREIWTVRGMVGAGVFGPHARRSLTYCVSDAFGAAHGEVVDAMEAAAATWEAAGDVDFRHVAELDGACDASAAVTFDVRPVGGQPYLARAFFPVSARAHRNLLVDDGAFAADAPALAAIFEHQLGHALGLDHTRIGVAWSCGEEEGGVMADLECAGAMGAGGRGSGLSSAEAAQIRAMYGAPSTSAPIIAGQDRTREASGLVAAGQRVELEPVQVAEGSPLVVELHGEGDLDLYVRFDDAPTRHAWDCRPYRADGHERCELEVPAGATVARVAVASAEPDRGDALTLADFSVRTEHVVPLLARPDVGRDRPTPEL